MAKDRIGFKVKALIERRMQHYFMRTHYDLECPSKTDIEIVYARFSPNIKEHRESLLLVLNHKYLHYVLLKEIGKEATVALDNLR